MNEISQAAPTPEKPKKNLFSRHGELLSTIGILIAAPVLAVLLTIFVFQSYEVDGPSMETTLQDNDRLIVNKIGKTWAKINGSDYIPDRYSIIVFHSHSSITVNGQNKQLIKRVIGLPGDRVVISNGSVKIYNSENPDGFSPDTQGPEAQVIETTSGNLDETVEDGEVFVMGDNRENSLDSRNFGPVKSSDIVGELAFRIFPFNSIKHF
ncbi:signal peptidase I [Candidatus Saccharibacteria bacterium]|nr:signal peptidase I [Candidatus Saccharibacteria bacterium]